MGYTANFFAAHVDTWIDAGWLPASGRLIDFGAQEFYCDQDEARGSSAAFLRRHGVPEDRIASALGTDGKVSVAKIYRAIGIDYVAIDVDEAHGSTFFDLNASAPPIGWRAAFDFVNNEGTIEHLVNPINGFQVAHEVLKVGGVARHSVPLTGHLEHGIVYPTVKFYTLLVGHNRYELLRADVAVGQTECAVTDQRFRLIDARDGSPLPAKEAKISDVWLSLVYRKTAAAEFRVPFDHLNVADPQALGERLSGAFSAYSRERLTADGRRDPVGDAFERAAELQRRQHEHETRLHWVNVVRHAWRRLSRRASRSSTAGRS
jgi:SAM-dependent methyltransferase